MNDKHAMPPLRFEFGRNWRQFLSTIDEASIQRVVDSLQSFLKLNSLEGKRFMDVVVAVDYSVWLQGVNKIDFGKLFRHG